MHAKAQQVCSLLDSVSALEARLEHKDERGAIGVLVLLKVHELVEGGRSSREGWTPCGKQKWAASGVMALPSGYWYRT